MIDEFLHSHSPNSTQTDLADVRFDVPLKDSFHYMTYPTELLYNKK